MTAAPNQPGRLYVVEQRGTIQVIENGQEQPQPFLDIRNLVLFGGERGLLSVAFSPQYATSRLFYIDYIDTNGDTRVVQYRSNGTSAILSSARLLFFVKQPFPNHKGGQLQFGPDGDLYIGLGDGGSEGDPRAYGQSLETKLAKIWKLDVGNPKARPVLVAYGLRNPWRFSFDRATGDLYIGDVGQDTWEEIDYVPRAKLGTLANFGWSVYEGRAPFDRARKLDTAGRLTWPVEVYSHRYGCSVTGGFVYRGKADPGLEGRYVYGDYCSGTLWSFRVRNGRATGLRREPGKITGLSSFGEDASGGLYAVSLGGTLYRIAG